MHIPSVPPQPVRLPPAVGRIGALGRPAVVAPAPPSAAGRRRPLLSAALAAVLRPLAARLVTG